jgi:hypothetical protein
LSKISSLTCSFFILFCLILLLQVCAVKFTSFLFLLCCEIYTILILYKVVTIASAALDAFKSEAKKMVVALVDMERAFVPPQHFIRLVQRR